MYSTVLRSTMKDKISIHTIVWDPTCSKEQFVSLANNCLQFWKFQGLSSLLPSLLSLLPSLPAHPPNPNKTKQTGGKECGEFTSVREVHAVYDKKRLHRLTAGCWDPHYPNRFISTNNTTIRVWDVSKGTLQEIQTIENAHKSCILSVDHNPNKPYHIITAGEDRTVRTLFVIPYPLFLCCFFALKKQN